jgi:hypothetical protein
MDKKFSFSGHEKFACKHFWLKKGYDFFSKKSKSSEESEVVELGVGKNMVGSIRHWAKAFGVLQENNSDATAIGEYLLGENGKDIYLEDYGTIWLFHYLLIKTNRASLYHLVFNNFRREKIDFTKDQLINFVERKCKEQKTDSFNRSTVHNDVDVFIRNYVKPEIHSKSELEDDFSFLLLELDLIKEYHQIIDKKKQTWYKIEVDDKDDLPWQIVLYAIMDNWNDQNSIDFNSLLTEINSPALVFALTKEGLYNKIKQMEKAYKRYIKYDETAGTKVLQIKSALTKQTVLDDYYEA